MRKQDDACGSKHTKKKLLGDWKETQEPCCLLQRDTEPKKKNMFCSTCECECESLSIFYFSSFYMNSSQAKEFIAEQRELGNMKKSAWRIRHTKKEMLEHGHSTQGLKVNGTNFGWFCGDHNENKIYEENQFIAHVVSALDVWGSVWFHFFYYYFSNLRLYLNIASNVDK